MKPRIPLDRHHRTGLIGKTFGQDAGAGPDLYHQIVRGELRRPKDQIAYGRRDEEALSKASPRLYMVLPEQGTGLMPKGGRPIRRPQPAHPLRPRGVPALSSMDHGIKPCQMLLSMTASCN